MTKTTTKRMSIKTTMQMFSLMTMMVASSIIPCTEAYVYRRSLPQTTTVTAEVENLTIIQEPPFSPLEKVKTSTNGKLNANVNSTSVSSEHTEVEKQLEAVQIQQNVNANESKELNWHKISSVSESESSGLTESFKTKIKNEVENTIEMDLNQIASSTVLLKRTGLNIYSQKPDNATSNTENIENDIDSKKNSETDWENTEVTAEATTVNYIERSSECKSENQKILSENIPVKEVNQCADETFESNIPEDNLSIVLSETETESTTIIPLVDTIENEINLTDLFIVNDIEVTTIPSSSSEHSVIKKDGVANVRELEQETTTVPNIEHTTHVVVIIETNDVRSFDKTIISVKDSSEEDNSSEDKSVENKTKEEIIIAEETTTNKDDSSEESGEISKEDSEDVNKNRKLNSTTSHPLIESSSINSGLEQIAEVLPENEHNAASNKGSRSISSVHGYGDSSVPPNNALNDKLNAESKLTQNVNSNSSQLVITISSGFIGLLVLIVFIVLIISFRSQHGTLDIELQEQRCGKDEFDEESSETRVKLLDVELPEPSAKTSILLES